MDAKEDADEVIPTKLEDFGYHFNKGKHPYDTQTWILGGGGGVTGLPRFGGPFWGVIVVLAAGIPLAGKALRGLPALVFA